MPDWLQDSPIAGVDLSPGLTAVRMLAATVAGLVVAGICQAAHGHRKSDAPMLLTTLVLLTVLIAMVTLVIGNSVARAFGLVGALSIVRFRTVVDDTRDTAFVIFAVITGMAIGAGAWMVPVVGIPVVGLVAIGLDRFSGRTLAFSPTHQLVIRLGLGRDPETSLSPTLNQHVPVRNLIGTATTRQGAAMELTYQVVIGQSTAETTLPRLVAALNQVDGVQQVEFHRR